MRVTCLSAKYISTLKQKLGTSMKVSKSVNHASVSLEGKHSTPVRRRGTCGLYTLVGYAIPTYERDDLIS